MAGGSPITVLDGEGAEAVANWTLSTYYGKEIPFSELSCTDPLIFSRNRVREQIYNKPSIHLRNMASFIEERESKAL
jgi:hypothetical protein